MGIYPKGFFERRMRDKSSHDAEIVAKEELRRCGDDTDCPREGIAAKFAKHVED
jgi:hypothetical protein